MNCTREHFEKEVWKTYPSKIMSANTGLHSLTIYAVDTINQSTLSDIEKDKAASHVWFGFSSGTNGTIIKDTTGLFIPLNPITTINVYPPSGLSMSLPSGFTFAGLNAGSFIPADFGYGSLGEEIVIEPTKCECGAHKVGSNQHSSWCQMNKESL